MKKGLLFVYSLQAPYVLIRAYIVLTLSNIKSNTRYIQSSHLKNKMYLPAA